MSLHTIVVVTVTTIILMVIAALQGAVVAGAVYWLSSLVGPTPPLIFIAGLWTGVFTTQIATFMTNLMAAPKEVA